MKFFYHCVSLVLIFSTIVNAKNASEISISQELENRERDLKQNKSLDVNDIYDKTKLHVWTKIFGANYSVRDDKKENLDYSFNNYGALAAIDFKPNEDSLIGIAYTSTKGSIPIHKMLTQAGFVQDMKFNLTTDGLSLFGGFRTPLGLRLEGILSAFKINADTKDAALKFMLANKDKVSAALFDGKVKVILDLVPNKEISLHPYVGLGYGTMISENLKHLNEDNSQLYSSWSSLFGISIWGYHNIGHTKVYPSLYAEYELPLNAKKADPKNFASNFSFGNKLNIGGSLYFDFKDSFDLELGYNFDINDKLKGSNYFFKLKFEF
jgi:hypothetical protein